MTGQVNNNPFSAEITDISRRQGVVQLKLTLQDGRVLNTTVRFDEPISRKKVNEYLNQVSTKEKLAGLIERHQLLTQSFALKENVKVRLTHSDGGETATVRYKKVSKETDGSGEDQENIKERKINMRAGDLAKEAARLKEKREGIKSKLEDTQNDSPDSINLRIKSKSLKMQIKGINSVIDTMVPKLRNAEKEEEQSPLIVQRPNDQEQEDWTELKPINTQEQEESTVDDLNPFSAWQKAMEKQSEEKEKEKEI